MAYEHSLYDINSYGIDYPIEVLTSMIQREDLVAPDFQRNYVWSISQASRFIESCIVGLPIPTIFFFKDEDNKFLIVDGLQRLMTAYYFKQGYFLKENRRFVLTSLDNPDLNGRSYDELPVELKRRFDQCVLRATVFAQNRPEKGMKSVYEVFSRLNSGGMKLTSHEVRNAIIRGGINSFLRDLNTTSSWRKLYGKIEPDQHMKDEEIILRILALSDSSIVYSSPMNAFLNNYMQININPTVEWLEARGASFIEASDATLELLGRDAFRVKKGSQVNIAIADAILAAFVQDVKKVKNATKPQLDKVREDIQKLKDSQDFVDLIEKNTTDNKKVLDRIRFVKTILDNNLGQ